MSSYSTINGSNNNNNNNNNNHNNNAPNQPYQETHQVKNRAAAEKQMTVEQLIRESENFTESEVTSTLQSFHSTGEVEEYKRNMRATFESRVAVKNKEVIGTFIAYARWEASLKEFANARDVFERAIHIDPRNVQLHLKYIEMELSHDAVQTARNVFDKATTLLPNEMTIWFKWIDLEQKLRNLDNIRAIFQKIFQPRIDSDGWIPPSAVFDKYIDFELRQKQFQKCFQIYEQYLLSYPLPPTYMQYAQFALFNGHLVDISTIYPATNTNDSNNNSTTNLISTNTFLEAHHKYKGQLLSTTDQQQLPNSASLRQPLTPQFIFQRAIRELKIIPLLDQLMNFENLHHHLLISQLSILNSSNSNNNNNNNNNNHHNDIMTTTPTNNSSFTPTNKQILPVISTSNDICHVQDILQQYEPLSIKTAEEMIKLLLFWAQLEETLAQRKVLSKSYQPNDDNIISPEYDNLPHNNNNTNTNNNINHLFQKSREILYFTIQHTPLRFQQLVIETLLSFEKRHGDTVMLDLALLQLTRLQYKDTLGIGYLSLLKLLFPNNNDNVQFSESSIVNGRRQLTVPILESSHISILQLKVRDFDIWLEWAKIEQRHVEEQVQLYSLYNNNNERSHNNFHTTPIINPMSQNPFQSLDLSSKYNNNADLTVPKQLSYLHEPVLYVYSSAQRFLPLMNNPQYQSITQNQQQQQQQQPRYPQYIVSTKKSDWQRYIYLTICHALYLELFQQDISAAKLVYSSCLNRIPSISFTFSNLWINLAYLELRYMIQQYQQHFQSSVAVQDHFSRFNSITTTTSTTTTTTTTTTTNNNNDNINNNAQSSKLITHEQLLEEEQKLYSNTVSKVRKIFSNGIGLVKRILTQSSQQSQQSQPSSSLSSHKQPNIKLFLAYIKFEQSVIEHSRVRELFESFLTDFSTNYQLWKDYIIFEANCDEVNRSRTLLQIALGLDAILQPLQTNSSSISIQRSTQMRSILLDSTFSPQSIFPIDTTKFIIPLIQYKPQLTKLDDSTTLSTIFNKIPLQRQIAPTTTPTIQDLNDINNLWELYCAFELNQINFEDELFCHRQSQIFNNAVQAQLRQQEEQHQSTTTTTTTTTTTSPTNMNWIHSRSHFTVFSPHQTLSFISCIPYLTSMFPYLYDLTIAHELWILSNPLSLTPYSKFAATWGQISQHFQSNTTNTHSTNSATKRLHNGTTKPTTMLGQELNSTTISSYLSLDFNQLFISTLGTTSTSDIPPTNLMALINSSSLSQFCQNIGRYILSLFHYRIVNELKLIQRIHEQLKGRTNEIFEKIIRLDFQSSQSALSDITAGNIEFEARLQKDNEEFGQLADTLCEHFLQLRQHVKSEYNLKLKRRDVLLDLMAYESIYGTDITRQTVKSLFPTSVKKTMRSMHPKPQDSTLTTTSTLNQQQSNFEPIPTNSTTLSSNEIWEQNFQKVAQILQSKWIMEPELYDDLLFPQDSQDRTTKLDTFKSKSKKLKQNRTPSTITTNTTTIAPTTDNSSNSLYEMTNVNINTASNDFEQIPKLE